MQSENSVQFQEFRELTPETVTFECFKSKCFIRHLTERSSVAQALLHLNLQHTERNNLSFAVLTLI
jgi:hypothetical protein